METPVTFSGGHSNVDQVWLRITNYLPKTKRLPLKLPRATMETGIIVPKIISGVAPIKMGIMGPKDYLWSGSGRVDATWTKILSSKLSKLILSALFTFSIFRTTPCIMVSGTFWSLFMAFMTLSLPLGEHVVIKLWLLCQ